mgnify:CR=1 FL=1
MSPLKPRASVVVPALPGDSRVAACLGALSAQTIRGELELVLSLDGSKRSSAEELADRVVRGPQAGPATARNRGWRAAAAGVILFTDADCVPRRDWAQRMLQALDGGAAAVKGVYSGGGQALIQRLAQVEFEERYAILSRGDSIDMVDTYSAGYRREALEAVGGFSEDFPVPDHEDVDLSYRLAAAGYRMALAPEAAVAHTHPATWRAYARQKFSRGRWRMRVVRAHPRRASGDGYTPLAMRLQILLAAAFLPVAAASLALAWLPPAYLSLWLLTSLPLAYVAVRRDPGVAALVPVFALVRAFSLFSGLFAGLCREAPCLRR